MMAKFFVSIFTFLILILNNAGAIGSTISLSSCSQTEVQNAMNNASDGDVISCPPGSWSWSNVNIPNKNITLQGAGIDQTTIMITAARGLEKAAGVGDKPFRITGFTFRSDATYHHDNGHAMIAFADGHGWRFDHNKVKIYSDVNTTWGGNGLVTLNDAAGLIDHNEFTDDDANPTNGCLHVGVYVMGSGTSRFNSPSMIGQTDGVVFIEDNIFDGRKGGKNIAECGSGGHGRHAVYAALLGGVYVFRHNDIYDADADVHPFCSTISGREFEISNNTWHVSSGFNLPVPIQISAATGVIYGNTRTGGGSINYGYRFQYWRLTTRTCSNIVFDGIIADTRCQDNEGYPCKGQPGTGLNGSVVDPIYIWNNTGFVGSKGTILNDPGSSWIQSGRDYYYSTGNNPKPGYVSYQYPHPLTGEPFKEISGDTSRIPNPPASIQVN